MSDINFFNRKSLYTGFSVKDFNNVRNILDINKISYRYKILNLDSHLWPNRFGRGGHYKDHYDDSHIIYEIFVHKSDYDTATYLLKKVKK